MTTWSRHIASGDRFFHTGEFGLHSYETSCRGTWPVEDAIETHDNPPLNERCGWCARLVEISITGNSCPLKALASPAELSRGSAGDVPTFLDASAATRMGPESCLPQAVPAADASSFSTACDWPSAHELEAT